MRRLAAFLAYMILVMLVLNIAMPKPVSLSMTYSININRINAEDASAGNSNNVAIDISIGQFGNFLCGLNEDNFIINTLSTPPDGYDAAIYSVGASFTSRGESSSCNYSINIAPVSFQDKQYPWVKGNYTFQIDFVRNGQQLTNKAFNLTMK